MLFARSCGFSLTRSIPDQKLPQILIIVSSNPVLWQPLHYPQICASISGYPYLPCIFKQDTGGTDSAYCHSHRSNHAKWYRDFQLFNNRLVLLDLLHLAYQWRLLTQHFFSSGESSAIAKLLGSFPSGDDVRGYFHLPFVPRLIGCLIC